MSVGTNLRETGNLSNHLAALTRNSTRTKDRLRSKIVKEAKERFMDELDKEALIDECELSAKLGNHEYSKEVVIDSNHPAYKLKYFEIQAILQNVMCEKFKGEDLKIEVSVNINKKIVISIAWY